MSLLIVLLLAQDRPPLPPPVDLALDGGTVVEDVALERIADGHVEFRRGDRALREPLERVAAITRRGVPEPWATLRDCVCVESIGPLACTILDFDARRVRVRTTLAGEIDVPTARVNDLVFGGAHYGAVHGATHVVVTKQTRHEAAAIEFTADGVRIAGNAVARADLVSIAFPARPAAKDKPGEGWYAWVEGVDGTFLSGAIRDMDPARLRLYSAALGPVTIDPRRMKSIRFDAQPRAGWTLLLISEDDGLRVYNPAGAVVWEWVAGNPCDAIVLPDGNLMYRHHEQKEVVTSSFAKADVSKFALDAVVEDFTRLSDGRIAVCTKSGLTILKADGTVDSTAAGSAPKCVAEAPGGALIISDESGMVRRGDPEHRWTRESLANLYDFVVLPDGHVLYAGDRMVVEIDDDGEAIWSSGELDSPSDALRLPNGNTLIIEDGPHRLIEMTPDRKIVWQKTWPKRIVDIFVIE